MIPLCEPWLQGKSSNTSSTCIETGWISSSGEYVKRLEKALATYIGVEHAVACNCGTSALHISLILSGVCPDDEVIVPTVTFIAPVNAVRYVDAWPVFIDCDEYCNIDVAAIRRFLVAECETRDGSHDQQEHRAAGVGDHPRACLRHLGRHGPDTGIGAASTILHVIEDASESLGSLYKGRKCGGLAPSAASVSTATRSSPPAVAGPS